MTVDGRAWLADREIRKAVTVEVAFRHAAAAPALWTLLVDPQRLSGRVRQLIARIVPMYAALSMACPPRGSVRGLTARILTPEDA
jgi:hypothetical protein